MSKIITLPTKKDWIKVIKELLDRGEKWQNGDDDIDANKWEEYEEKTAICLLSGDGFYYERISELKAENPAAKIITAKQFLSGKPIVYKFVVLWDERDKDPSEMFETLAEAKNKVKELVEDEDVIKSSIKIIEIAKMYKIETDIKVKKIY